MTTQQGSPFRTSDFTFKQELAPVSARRMDVCKVRSLLGLVIITGLVTQALAQSSTTDYIIITGSTSTNFNSRDPTSESNSKNVEASTAYSQTSGLVPSATPSKTPETTMNSADKCLAGMKDKVLLMLMLGITVMACTILLATTAVLGSQVRVLRQRLHNQRPTKSLPSRTNPLHSEASNWGLLESSSLMVEVELEENKATSADASPQDASPQDASPQDASPQDASPQDASPQDASPQDASPQDKGTQPLEDANP